MPRDYLNTLPRFIGEDEKTTENHVSVFCNFAANKDVEHVGVSLILFVPVSYTHLRAHET